MNHTTYVGANWTTEANETREPADKPYEYRCHICLIREDDGRYSAVVLNLPGIGSCGGSEVEATWNARQAIIGAIESYVASGEEIPWTDAKPEDIPAGAKQFWILVRSDDKATREPEANAEEPLDFGAIRADFATLRQHSVDAEFHSLEIDAPMWRLSVAGPRLVERCEQEERAAERTQQAYDNLWASVKCERDKLQADLTSWKEDYSRRCKLYCKLEAERDRLQAQLTEAWNDRNHAESNLGETEKLLEQANTELAEYHAQRVGLSEEEQKAYDEAKLMLAYDKPFALRTLVRCIDRLSRPKTLPWRKGGKSCWSDGATISATRTESKSGGIAHHTFGPVSYCENTYWMPVSDLLNTLPKE